MQQYQLSMIIYNSFYLESLIIYSVKIELCKKETAEKMLQNDAFVLKITIQS